MDKISILNDIKKHYGFRKKTEFAKFLGVSPQTLSNWMARNTYDPELIYNKCKDINPEWLLSGKGNLCKTYTKENVDMVISSEPSTSYSTNKKEIPIYDWESGISLHEISNNKTIKPVIESKFIRVPGISDCNAACYVKDNSMFPIIKAGDIIIFKSTTKQETLSGEMYLVETERKINNKKCRFIEIQILHKIIPERDVYVFHNKNTYPKKHELSSNQIISIAHIKASICFQ